MTAQALKTALITGAAKRLGREMALALAHEGYAVCIHYLNSHEAALDIVQKINDNGGKAVSIKGDLSDRNAIADLINKASIALGAPLSLLINSASTFEQDELENMTSKSWDMHLETNLYAPVKLLQDFAAQAADGNNNLVINILDQRVKKLTPQFFSYTISKSALETVTITAAQSLGPKKIRVNAINPGPTLRNKRQSKQDWEKQNKATILGHGATPDDIIAAMFYLINAPAVTGQTITVDGGQHLAWQTPDTQINE